MDVRWIPSNSWTTSERAMSLIAAPEPACGMMEESDGRGSGTHNGSAVLIGSCAGGTRAASSDEFAGSERCKASIGKFSSR
jgi:hypothetical protein